MQWINWRNFRGELFKENGHYSLVADFGKILEGPNPLQLFQALVARFPEISLLLWDGTILGEGPQRLVQVPNPKETGFLIARERISYLAARTTSGEVSIGKFTYPVSGITKTFLKHLGFPKIVGKNSDKKTTTFYYNPNEVMSVKARENTLQFDFWLSGSRTKWYLLLFENERPQLDETTVEGFCMLK